MYFRYQGTKFAATATEVALYDQLLSGDIKNKLGFATHQNLPLAMFLELPQLGYPAYSGPTSGIIDDATIINQLGLGIVNFKEQHCCDHAPDCPCLEGKPDGPDCSCKENHPGQPCEPGTPGCVCKPKVSTWDYEYRTDTDVITAIKVTAEGEIDPDDDAEVTFKILGKTYTKGYVIPSGNSQLVWVKWHTPKEPQVVNISVSASRGSIPKSTIVCNVVDLVEKTPPNPTGRDRNDGFRPVSRPTYPQKTTASWSEWHASWDEDDHDWDFYSTGYSAKLTTSMKLQADEKVPTAINRYQSFEMKSGYGYNIEYTASVTSWTEDDKPSEGSIARTSDITPIQNVVTLFPEFQYKLYDRLLEPTRTGYYSVWEFFQNKYSMTKQRVHFTPIWYPDGNYTTYAIGFDAWTPDGMLVAENTFDFKIDGNVYDDWFISPIA